MLRLIPFAPYTEDSAPSKRYFDICWLAVTLQGNPRDPSSGAKGRPARKQAKRILSEFRGISERIAKAPDGHEGRNLLTLAKAGGEVALSEEDFKKVVEWIDDIPWKADGVEDADDCVTWLEEIKPIKAKEVKALLADNEKEAAAAPAEPETAAEA